MLFHSVFCSDIRKGNHTTQYNDTQQSKPKLKALSIITVSIMPLRIMTLGLMTIILMILSMTLTIRINSIMEHSKMTIRIQHIQ